MPFERDEDGAIVGAVDLFHRGSPDESWSYVRTIYDAPKNHVGVVQVQLHDGDHEEGEWCVMPSFGPENVIVPGRHQGTGAPHTTKPLEPKPRRSKDQDDMVDAILLAVGEITGVKVDEATESRVWNAVEDILIFGAPVPESGAQGEPTQRQKEGRS